jgi:tyrosine-protein phosphatase
MLTLRFWACVDEACRQRTITCSKGAKLLAQTCRTYSHSYNIVPIFNLFVSLIYQLLDYERALKGQDSPGRSSTGASEDEEWERRRQQLDSPDQESQEILKEAKELDREMEERRARRLSLASTSSNPSSFTGAIGNGAPWRVRYGSGVYSRSRAPSMESSYTSRSSVSVVSEDPLEEEDETDDRDPTKVTTPDTDATDEDAHCYGMNKEEIDHPQTAQAPRFKATLQPPSAPPTRTTFGLAPPPSASPFKQSFGSSAPVKPPSTPSRLLRASAAPTLPSIRTQDISGPQNKKEKRRPPPLKDVTPTVPFPSIQLTTDEPIVTNPTTLSRHSSNSSQRSAILPSATPTGPKPIAETVTSPRTRRLSQRISSLVPFPVKNAIAAISSVMPRSPAPNAKPKAAPTPSASQTLFIFPPSPRTRGTSTPATLTLTSTPLPSAGFGSILTPRANLFRRRTDSRMSWFGASAATPTTATARVDVKGQFDAN